MCIVIAVICLIVGLIAGAFTGLYIAALAVGIEEVNRDLREND